MKSKVQNIYLKYIITYFVIAFSDIPFFDANKLARTGFLLLLTIMFVYYNKKVNKELFVVLSIAILIMLMQSLKFEGGKLYTSFTIIGLLFLLPFFAIKLIGPQFLKYYRDVLYLISVISLIFWLADNFVPGFHRIIHTIAGQLMPFTPWHIQESIIVYTWEDMQVYGFFRNPGPFHEPGAFAVFLMPAMIAEIFISGKFLTKKNILFLINLITTFSTAGFLGLSTLIGFYVFSSKKMTVLTKYATFILLFAVIIFMFMQLEFLGDKITSQYEEQSEAHLTSKTVGRFLGWRKSVIAISRYPIFGRGLFTNAKADEYAEDAARYGWLAWISRIGLIAGLLYMYYFYNAIKFYSSVNMNSKSFSYFAYIAILLVLSAQKHTSSLVFFMIFLTPIMYPLKKYWKEYQLSDINLNNKANHAKTQIMSFDEYTKFLQKAKIK